MSNLVVQPAQVMPMCPEDEPDEHPGTRRGHTMTTTRLGTGVVVAVVLGGWGHDKDGLAPTLLSRLSQHS